MTLPSSGLSSSVKVYKLCEIHGDKKSTWRWMKKIRRTSPKNPQGYVNLRVPNPPPTSKFPNPPNYHKMVRCILSKEFTPRITKHKGIPLGDFIQVIIHVEFFYRIFSDTTRNKHICKATFTMMNNYLQ